MFLLEYPIIGTLSFSIFFWRSKYPVGKRDKALRYCNVDFLRRFLVGFVDSGEPSRVRSCFTLCPDLNRSVFVLLSRIDKEEPLSIVDCLPAFFSYFLRLGSILDINSIFFSALVSLIQLNGKLIISIFVRKGTTYISFLIAEIHAMDKHCLRIQNQRICWIEVRRCCKPFLPIEFSFL